MRRTPDVRRARAGRAVSLAVLAELSLLGLLALQGFGPAGAQTASQSGATVNQTGWWSRANAVPSTPAPGVTLPPLTAPPPPGVPAGTMAAGATGGQADKIAAVGIVPGTLSGTVERATLTIPEAKSGTQINNPGPDAAILACPITQFWVGASNGQWNNLPPFDCAMAKAAGTRGPSGVWTWDITSIAALWLTPGGLSPNGVALVPDVPSSSRATYQVVLTATPADIGVELDATPTTRTTITGAPVAPTTTPATSRASGATTGTSRPSPTAPSATTAPAPTTTAPAQSAAPPQRTSVSSRAAAILGNFPGGTFLLVPVALISAALLMFVYGPLGDPVTGVAREGGVSRALAARERAAGAADQQVATEGP